MCSLSWIWKNTQKGKKLNIYFNRDESKKRKQAQAPKKHNLGKTQALMPIDTQRGGTWISSNDHGITLALLNNYAIQEKENNNYESRGNLVKILATETNSQQLIEQLKKHLKSTNYPGFTLALFDFYQQQQQFFHWNGNTLNMSQPKQAFFTSSSWKTEQVQNFRIKLFQEYVEKNKMSHEAFHRLKIKGKEAWMPYVEREKTATVSITEITQTIEKTTMLYTAYPSHQQKNAIETQTETITTAALNKLKFN